MMASRGSVGRGTLPGKVSGRYYDEAGNELAIRADVFNGLPPVRRPRVYDHRGLRVVRLDVVPHDIARPATTEAPRGASMLRTPWDVALGVIRLFLRVMLLFARLV